MITVSNDAALLPDDVTVRVAPCPRECGNQIVHVDFRVDGDVLQVRDGEEELALVSMGLTPKTAAALIPLLRSAVGGRVY